MADCCFCKWSELLGNKSPIVFVDWGLSTGKSGSMVIQAYNLPPDLKTRQLVASEISLRGPETIQGTPMGWTPVTSVAARETKEFEKMMSRLKAAYGNNVNMNAEIDSIFSAEDLLAPLSMDYKKLLHRLKTLDGQSFQENNVGVKNERIREIFGEFKSKFDDYIFVDNNELMDKINSKITNLTNVIKKAETNLNRATFQNYNSLINRISRKIVMNKANKDQVLLMAAKAKQKNLSKENKQEILKLLKTTKNTEGVNQVSNRITQMLNPPEPPGGFGTLPMSVSSQATPSVKGNANTNTNTNATSSAQGQKRKRANAAAAQGQVPVPAKIKAKMLSAEAAEKNAGNR
jgi:hypothetical protein